METVEKTTTEEDIIEQLIPSADGEVAAKEDPSAEEQSPAEEEAVEEAPVETPKAKKKGKSKKK